MSRYYFKKLSGTLWYADGKHRRVFRGDEIPPTSELREGELDKLIRRNDVASQAEWDAGEKVPHHLRPPHRSTTVDPRNLRDPEPSPAPEQAPAEEDAGDAQSAPAEPEGLDLGSLDDKGLAALWEDGRAPKVKDLIAAVGDDPELAARVLHAEEEGTGGQSRSTLTDKLGKLVEGSQ